jgi:hypothetical protein
MIKLVRYFVYTILDTSEPDATIYQVGDNTIQINYKPIYIGRGCGDRQLSHVKSSHNPRVKQFVEKNKNSYKIEKLIDNISWKESVLIEQTLIYSIGRLDLDKGPLYNDSAGVHWTDNDVSDFKITPLNLELNKLQLVIKRLNALSNRKKVAESLGISERTLYRLMNLYNIKSIKIGHRKYKYYQL